MATSDRVSPSRAWFIVPVILLLAAALLAGLGLSSFLDFVRSDIRAYQPGSSVSVTEDGFTLYAPAEATLAISGLSCTARSQDGEVRLSSNGRGSTFSNEQGRFVAIGSTPAGTPAGQYAIACVDETAAATNVPLYVGPPFDFAKVARGVVFGVVVPLFLGFCAVALFGLLAFLRYRSGRKARSNGGQPNLGQPDVEASNPR